MHTSAHLHFKGNCREAFRFYAEVLGGRMVFAMTYGESPAAAETPPEMRDQIIHARLDLGEQFLLGCDTPPDRYLAPQGFNVMAAVEQPAQAEELFRALACDGVVTMPCQETFWAQRFGMCTDRFGIPWMVNCAKPLEALAGATAEGRPERRSVA
jgi:PhnB protein